jgi:hypothetical protein
MQRFIALLGKYSTNSLRIVDLNYVFNILVGVAEIQERLCKLADWTESYYLKVKLLNCWRTIPYIDVPDVLGQIRGTRFADVLGFDDCMAAAHWT